MQPKCWNFLSKRQKVSLGFRILLCSFLSPPPNQKGINSGWNWQTPQGGKGVPSRGSLSSTPSSASCSHQRSCLIYFLFPYVVDFFVVVANGKFVPGICYWSAFPIFFPAGDIEMENHSGFSCPFGERGVKGVHGWLHVLVETSLGYSSPSWAGTW